MNDRSEPPLTLVSLLVDSFVSLSPFLSLYIYIYIYVQTRCAEREREGEEHEWTEGESNRCGVCNFALSLSLSLRLSLRGYAPFDALGDVHTIKQGNTRDKGGSKRTLRLGAQPSKLPPPRILRETYCLRISIFRATRQTQLFFLSFYSSFSFSFFFFVSFPFPFFVSVFSFLFFPCSPFFGSSRYAAVVSYLVDDVFAPLLKIF